MPANLWLTDEDSLIEGYKRAKLGARSDCTSLVRSITDSGTSPVPITRSPASGSSFGAGDVLKWITDPLDGPSLTANFWELHVWAKQSSASGNIGLRLNVTRYTTLETTNVVTDSSASLTTTCTDVAYTTTAATSQVLAKGDRLVVKLSLVDAGGVMVLGTTGQVSYNGQYARAEGDSYVYCPNYLSTLEDIADEDVSAVRLVLRDAAGPEVIEENMELQDDEIKKFIRQAVNQYSVDRPHTTAAYLTGDNTTYEFPLPGQWIWGFSRISQVEFPADEQIAAVRETVEWDVRETVLGVQPLRFIRFTIATPDSNAWIQFTTRHVHNMENSTIPVQDFDAVLWLAGSFSATAMASKGARSNDSTISADSINYRDLQTRWRQVAEDLKMLYTKRVVEPDSATPVGSTENWDSMMTTGANFLWHSGQRIRRVM